MNPSTGQADLLQALPEQVLEVFRNFMTAETTTIGKNGYPVSWPVLPLFCPRPFQFVVLTSIGLLQKAVNVRRDGRVSLLFSEPAGSDLAHPPAVLVQGQAEAPDDLLIPMSKLDPAVAEAVREQGLRIVRKQPGMRMYLANSISRWLMDWYFMRQAIYIHPDRITWWPEADFSRTPETLEVRHVE